MSLCSLCLCGERSFEFLPDFCTQPATDFRAVASVGVALPEDSDVAQELVDRAAALAQRLNGRWVAFVICNDSLPSPRAESALRHAELAMRSGGTVFF